MREVPMLLTFLVFVISGPVTIIYANELDNNGEQISDRKAEADGRHQQVGGGHRRLAHSGTHELGRNEACCGAGGCYSPAVSADGVMTAEQAAASNRPMSITTSPCSFYGEKGCGRGQQQTSRSCRPADEDEGCAAREVCVSTCEDCPGGRFKAPGCSVAPTCNGTLTVRCEAGEYLEDGAYADRIGAGAKCVGIANCPGGSFCSEWRRPCPAGRYGSLDLAGKTTEATACPDLCPAGYMSPVTGSVSADDCRSCPYADRCTDDRGACVVMEGETVSRYNESTGCALCSPNVTLDDGTTRRLYQMSGQCVRCPEGLPWGIIILVLLTLLALIAFWLIDLTRWTKLAALKQIASYTQNLVIISLIPEVLPDLYREAVDWFNKMTNWLDLETVGPECAGFNFSWDERFMLTALVFIGPLVLLFAFTFCCCGGKGVTASFKSFPTKVKQAVVFWIFIPYTTITVMSTKAFQHRDGKFYYEPTQDMGSVSHVWAMVCAAVLFVTIIFGVPYYIHKKTTGLRDQGKLDDLATLENYGEIYELFRNDHVDFEAYILLRRALGIIIVICIPSEPVAQISVLLVISVGYFLLVVSPSDFCRALFPR